ncbi:MAG: hypothetical protein JW883_17300 [Deltaproteobacteria bacterium]|nr:hypothetical protein [Deltaproteobacteria bacterium]
MADLLDPQPKRGKQESPSSPSLQEMGKSLESRNICEMTCPSLQDPIWQELDSNCLVSQKKTVLTCPSLQDFEGDVSCPVVFAVSGYVSHTADVGSYIAASNPGSVPSSTAGRLAGYLGSLDHVSSFAVARVFSGDFGSPSCYSIGDS